MILSYKRFEMPLSTLTILLFGCILCEMKPLTDDLPEQPASLGTILKSQRIRRQTNYSDRDDRIAGQLAEVSQLAHRRLKNTPEEGERKLGPLEDQPTDPALEERSFDMLGGGEIPFVHARSFDSLGGGEVPFFHDRRSSNDKKKRYFDSLGGGEIPWIDGRR